jgi:hypothetical protein
MFFRVRTRSSGFNGSDGLTSWSEAAAVEVRRKASNVSPALPLRIGEPDVDRANAEDGDHDGLFDSVRYAVIVEGPRCSLDITACRHRHSQFRREVELRLIFGDGVNQAADLVSGATSIPSRNLTPLMTFDALR